MAKTEPVIDPTELSAISDTEESVEPEPIEIVQRVAENEPAAELEELTLISHKDAIKPIEKPKPMARLEWHQDFSVFEETPFDLCGYSEFTVKGDANGNELIVRSRDRSIPDTPFRGLESRVTVNKTTELFTGCRALFNYSVTGSVARIRIRSNKGK